MTAVQAADPGVLIPYRYRAAHPTMPLAVSGHQAAVALETAAAPEAATFNAHVALWRSFDVPAAVNGTQPTNINDFGEITGVYFDSNGNQHGFLRKADGKIATFDAPDVGYPFGGAGLVTFAAPNAASTLMLNSRAHTRCQ